MKLVRYKATLETLTPLHIGSGEKENSLFVIYDWAGTKFRYSFEEFIKKYLENNDSVEELVDSLLKALGSKDDSSEVKKEFYKKIIDTFGGTDQEKKLNRLSKTTGDVSLFVSSDIGPYVPGSSLKGALINSAYFNISPQDITVGIKEKENKKYNKKTKKILITNKKINSLYKRDKDGVRSPRNYIRIRDSHTIDKNCLDFYGITRKNYLKNKEGAKTIVECVVPKTEIKFEIIGEENSVKKMLEESDKFYRTVLREYESRKMIKDNFEDEIGLNEKDKLLLLGFGTTLLAKTPWAVQNISRNELRMKKIPQTIWTYEDKPLGVTKIKVEKIEEKEMKLV